MTRNLVVVVSGGALAFALAGVASPAVAWGSIHPVDVTKAKLFMPPPTPVIRDAAASPGHPGKVTIWNPGDPPVITRSKVGGPARTLTAQADTPTVRDSTARLGDPDDGGQ